MVGPTASVVQVATEMASLFDSLQRLGELPGVGLGHGEGLDHLPGDTTVYASRDVLVQTLKDWSAGLGTVAFATAPGSVTAPRVRV